MKSVDNSCDDLKLSDRKILFLISAVVSCILLWLGYSELSSPTAHLKRTSTISARKATSEEIHDTDDTSDTIESVWAQLDNTTEPKPDTSDDPFAQFEPVLGKNPQKLKDAKSYRSSDKPIYERQTFGRQIGSNTSTALSLMHHVGKPCNAKSKISLQPSRDVKDKDMSSLWFNDVEARRYAIESQEKNFP